MELPQIPAPLLALLDESRDLARRIVEAHERQADATALLALRDYAHDLYEDPRDTPERAARVTAARTMTARAIATLGRRLTVRVSATAGTKPGNEPLRPLTPAERQQAHRARKRSERP